MPRTLHTLTLTCAGALLAGTALPGLADQASTRGGISVQSADGTLAGTIGGLVQLDGAVFDNDQIDRTSGVEFRRARLRSGGKIYGVGYEVEVDFADDRVDLTNAYLHWDLGPRGGQIKLGQFRQPYSLSNATGAGNTVFMERAFVERLAPGFQIGAQYARRIGPVALQTALFSTDDNDAGQDEGFGGSLRLSWFGRVGQFAKVHVGANYLMEDSVDGSAVDANGNPQPRVVTVRPLGHVSDAVTLLSASDGTVSSARYGAELAAVAGPISLQFEYANGNFEDDSIDQDIAAYYVQAGFFVTGETRPYDRARGAFGRLVPKSDWGAIEVAVRFDYIENDDLAVDAEIENNVFAINYYRNPQLRFAVNYVDSDLIDGLDESSAVYARAQFDF